MSKATHSKIPHRNTKVLIDLKKHKDALDAMADKANILPTTLARNILIAAVKKGSDK